MNKRLLLRATLLGLATLAGRHRCRAGFPAEQAVTMMWNPAAGPADAGRAAIAKKLGENIRQLPSWWTTRRVRQHRAAAHRQRAPADSSLLLFGSIRSVRSRRT